MDEKANWKAILVACLIVAFFFTSLLSWGKMRELKLDLANGLRNAFAPEITEIETAAKKAEFNGCLRSINNDIRTELFLGSLLRSGIFVSEMIKRQDRESFRPPVRGWRVPWKQEFSEDGKLTYEWGLLFRMDGTKGEFPVCLVYHYNGTEVLGLEYLGNHHGLPTVEEAKNAIVAALKK